MRDDATLVELAIGGDSSAFAELYERYFDRVYDFLARMVRSEAEAADLAQDTFLRAMNSLGSLTKGGSFKSWLFTIARNTALNRIERSARVQSFQTGRSDEDDEPAFDVVDDDRFGDPEQAAEAKALAAYVWEAAKGLEPNQYAVLDLSVRQGLESAEIADVLGVTKNNAYVMVNRMKKSLEEAIGALVLFKSGRTSCPELDAALTRLELGEMSPEARRLIDRHANKCEVCSEKKRKMTSPFAIFGGFAMVQPALGTKGAILEGLLQGFPYGGGTGGAGDGGDGGSGGVGGSGTGNGDSGGGQGSLQPAVSGGGASSYGMAAPAADEDGGGRKAGLLKMAAGAAAVIVAALITFAGVSSMGGGGEEEEAGQPLVALVVSPSATAAPATATAVPTEAPTEVPTAEATEEPTATPPTPVAAAPGPQQPGLAPNAPPPTQEPQAAPPQVEEPPLPPPPAAPPPTPCVPGIGASAGALEFGTGVSSLTFSLGGNNCGEAAEYSATSDETWATVLPASGRVPPGGAVTLTVRVDRAAVGREGGSAAVNVSGAWGSLRVAVRVQPAPVVVTSTPTPRGPNQIITPPTRTPTPVCTPNSC
jgi:RNA polymerase sigma factor (sigma-70 family)